MKTEALGATALHNALYGHPDTEPDQPARTRSDARPSWCSPTGTTTHRSSARTRSSTTPDAPRSPSTASASTPRCRTARPPPGPQAAHLPHPGDRGHPAAARVREAARGCVRGHRRGAAHAVHAGLRLLPTRLATGSGVGSRVTTPARRGLHLRHRMGYYASRPRSGLHASAAEVARRAGGTGCDAAWRPPSRRLSRESVGPLEPRSRADAAERSGRSEPAASQAPRSDSRNGVWSWRTGDIAGRPERRADLAAA